MSIARLIGLLAALVVMIFASSAFAIAAITDQQKNNRDQIERQLGPSHSFALLIGISEFDNPGWRPLKVEQEIRDVRLALEDQNFTVESQIGRLDIKALTERISLFFRANGQRAENRLVVYIATHGYADPSNPDPEGFLIASDSGAPANGRIDKGYSVNELDLVLRDLEAQHVFLFFNSCFSAAMLPDPTRDTDPLLVKKPKKALDDQTAKWTLDLLSHNARLVLTAGDATQTVPDGKTNPFSLAVVAALKGEADADGDGLILGSEIGQFVRGRVARATRLANHPNDPIFAVIPKERRPEHPRPDAPPDIVYALQGDFIFLTPDGPKQTASGDSEQDLILKDKRRLLRSNQFVACVDCPTMIEVPGSETGKRLALSSTEITYAQWDACFRESICRRFLPDDGFGRGDRPAGGVTWLDALEYTTWLTTKSVAEPHCDNYRLPTSKEWQAAALYGNHGDVTWNVAVADSFPVCWGCGPGQDGTNAVRTASAPANPAGLYDMVGNLWEWVEDDTGVCDPDAVDSDLCKPGRVMGGSYATSVAELSGDRVAKGGVVPRTGNDAPWSSPTIGIRVACSIKAAG